MVLDKSTLLAALKPQTAEITIDGIGTVRIRKLSIADVDSVRRLQEQEDAKKELGLYFVIRSVVDDEGKPLFEEADIAMLRETSNSSMEALAEAVLKYNGLLKDEAAPN